MRGSQYDWTSARVASSCLLDAVTPCIKFVARSHNLSHRHPQQTWAQDSKERFKHNRARDQLKLAEASALLSREEKNPQSAGTAMGEKKKRLRMEIPRSRKKERG